VDNTPAPVEVLIPEARHRQRRRYKRSAILVSIVVLLVGALVALLITSTSSGSGTSRGRSKPSVVVAGRATVLIRPVLCWAWPYVANQKTSGPIPPCAAPYELTAAALSVAPNSAQAGYSSNIPKPDPTFVGFSNSTHDSATQTVLLGGLAGKTPVGQRWVLGPSEMTLSAADVESASAQKDRIGEWIVNVHLSPEGIAAFNRVARENFHQFLAIDVGGKIVSTPLIEPGQATFSSFEGPIEVAGAFNASNARDVATAMKG
jgi:hypothetical protein